MTSRMSKHTLSTIGFCILFGILILGGITSAFVNSSHIFFFTYSFVFIGAPLYVSYLVRFRKNTLSSRMQKLYEVIAWVGYVLFFGPIIIVPWVRDFILSQYEIAIHEFAIGATGITAVGLFLMLFMVLTVHLYSKQSRQPCRS